MRQFIFEINPEHKITSAIWVVVENQQVESYAGEFYAHLF